MLDQVCAHVSHGCTLADTCFSATTLFAATSQLSFWWQTGGDIEWADAAAFALHDEGRKVLMSGSGTAMAIGSAIVVVAWITKGVLSRFISAFVASVEARIFARTYSRLSIMLSLRRHTNTKPQYYVGLP